MKWSDAELAVITKAVLGGKTAREVHESGLLPNRSLNDIYNYFQITKADLNGRCRNCKNQREEGSVRCAECKSKARERQRGLVASGKCGRCRKVRKDNDGGGLTLCLMCVEEKRASNRTYQKRRHATRKRAKRTGSLGRDKRFNKLSLLHWSYTGSIRLLPEFFPSTDHTFVDVFGGSGRFTALAHVLGYKRLVWNDLHPLLIDYQRLMAEGRYREVFEEAAKIAMNSTARKFLGQYRRALKGSYKPEKRAALLLVMSLSNRVKTMYEPKIGKLTVPPDSHLMYTKKPREAMSAAILCKNDFGQVIEEYDSTETFFFLDPPYPGTLQFENNLTYEDTERLAQALENIEGRFLMTCRPDRTVLKQFSFAYAYEARVQAKGHVREMWLTNYKLPSNDQVLPLDPAKFGILVEQKPPVRKVLSLDTVKGNVKQVIRKHLDDGYEVVFRPGAKPVSESPSWEGPESLEVHEAYEAYRAQVDDPVSPAEFWRYVDWGEIPSRKERGVRVITRADLTGWASE